METFAHIKTVIGIILGLSITHLLKGVVKIIEHPEKSKPYWVHLLWALYIFFVVIHFWWWEVHLNDIRTWDFSLYFFLIVYIMMYYFVCTLLFPDQMGEYAGFEEYFYSRKSWFFGVLGVTFAADIIDTVIKGKEYMDHLYWDFPIRNIVHIILCLVAMKVSNKKFHAVLVILFLAYELLFIARKYYT